MFLEQQLFLSWLLFSNWCLIWCTHSLSSLISISILLLLASECPSTPQTIPCIAGNPYRDLSKSFLSLPNTVGQTRIRCNSCAIILLYQSWYTPSVSAVHIPLPDRSFDLLIRVIYRVKSFHDRSRSFLCRFS